MPTEIPMNEAPIVNRDSLFFTSTKMDFLLHKTSSPKVLLIASTISQMRILEQLIWEVNPETKIDWEVDAHRALRRISHDNESESLKGYDLIICDLKMKGTSLGKEIFDYCKKYEPSTEVILISSSREDSSTALYEIDIEQYPVGKKPLDFSQFYQRISPVLIPA